ncbi:hypothetical protein ACRAWF_41360 [Streptomyces sp. L7]
MAGLALAVFFNRHHSWLAATPAAPWFLIPWPLPLIVSGVDLVVDVQQRVRCHRLRPAPGGRVPEWTGSTRRTGR